MNEVTLTDVYPAVLWWPGAGLKVKGLVSQNTGKVRGFSCSLLRLSPASRTPVMPVSGRFTDVAKMS